MATRWSELNASAEELEEYSPFAPPRDRGEEESPVSEEVQTSAGPASWRSPFVPFLPETEPAGPAREEPVEGYEWSDEEDVVPELEVEESPSALEHGIDREYADDVAPQEAVCHECGRAMEMPFSTEAGDEEESASAFAGGDVARSYERGLLAESEFIAAEDRGWGASAAQPELEGGDDAAVSALGAEWSQHRGGSPTPDAMTAWLRGDRHDTIVGARARFGTKYTEDAIAKAWLISRREQMGFQLATGVGKLGAFAPPEERVGLVSSPLIEDSTKAPVAPIMVRFVEELNGRFGSGVRASNYRGHGGGKFNDRGYSLDLFLKGADDRGFYRPADALRLLRATHEAASAVGAEWRIIYNDFGVADAINRALGKQHVIFVGTARRDGQKRVTGLNWHGPAPLILHFHLDLTPRSGAGGTGVGAATSSATSTPAPAPSGTASSATVRFAQRVLNAVDRAGLSDDGDLGPRTRAALERFRKQHQIGAGGLLDEKTDLALVQRALEELARQSMFAQAGVRDAATDGAIAQFRAQHGLGSGAAIDSALRAALGDALARRGAPATRPGTPVPVPTSGAPAAGPAAGRVKIEESTMAVVEGYRSLAEAAGAKYGIDPALVLGVIAAESGGKADLVAKSGYTGVMQSDKGEAQKVPATSIDFGTRKLRDFRKIMEGILATNGRRYDELVEPERLRLLALAYNAGPVTVAKALQYAARAGNPDRWLDGEHYKRALLFTGAYSLKQAAASCMKGVGAAEQQARMREATAVWNEHRIGTKKVSWRKLGDPHPWSTMIGSLPPLLVCAIDFKHRNSPGYAAKILAYRDRFRSR